MRVDIASLEDGPLRFAGTTAAPREVRVAGDPSLTAPIAFGASVELDGDAVRVTGWLHSTVRLPCSRCLESTTLSVERVLELVFRSASNAPESGATELDARQLDIDYYAGNTLDLRSVLAEQVLLALPMKPLCSENCEGLCPQCGANRRGQACECQPDVDPRLSPLAALRDRQ